MHKTKPTKAHEVPLLAEKLSQLTDAGGKEAVLLRYVDPVLPMLQQMVLISIHILVPLRELSEFKKKSI